VGDVIVVEGLMKRFLTNVALRGINLRVGEGESLLILGANGSGKSTLIKVLAGLLRPDAGKVVVLGRRPWPRGLGNDAGVLLDNASLPWWVKGVDLARLVADLRGVEFSEVLKYAEALGVDAFWGRRVFTYSTGMRRRLALLLTVVGEPPLLLLDEPFNALDAEGVRAVLRVLTELKRRSTIVMATHVIPSEMLQLFSNAVLLRDGRVDASGEPGEVLNAYLNLS